MSDIFYYFATNNPTPKMHFKCCVCGAFHRYKDGKTTDGKMFVPHVRSRSNKMEYAACQDHVKEARSRLQNSLRPDYSDAAFQLGLAP